MLSPDVAHILPATDTFQEVIPAVLPMFHIYGFTVLSLSTLIIGSKVVTLRKFAPDVYISVLKNYNVTSVIAAPPLVLFLTVHPDVKTEYLQSVRLVISGAAPLGSLDEERFLEKNWTTSSYASRIRSDRDIASGDYIHKKAFEKSSVGKLVPNTFAKIIAVDDPTGTPLGPNQSGELLVKGPQVMRGYHNKPEETKNAFLDGWFRTGDLMHYNEDGLFYVTDRLKELIKVKGFQVAPAELEEAIRDFPSVQDAAVIGIPHPMYGEVPRAYVVPKAKAQLKTEELQKYIANKLAEYKQLKGGVEVVDSIPKNAAGKILRRQLKLQYEARN
ncbi:hypothetical protein NQ318_010188 [Aromia moschata]|uniref:Uncharacterized protein n=1 Tax=Aromia moschata TaxID=1265417 RepID=A0AAV8Y433_9CUCU|nr:hypothetical protein NQ318_010188 [Aromia moschata]